MLKNCPKCGLATFGSDSHCKCGHDFSTPVSPAAPPSPAPPPPPSSDGTIRFTPSPGQTLLGMTLAVVVTVLHLSFSIWYQDWLCGSFVLLAGVGFGWLVLRSGKWKLEITPKAIVQTTARGVERFAWPEVTEVVQVQKWSLIGTRRIGMKIVAGTKSFRLGGALNFRFRDRMYDAVMEAARRHGVPVSVERVI